MDPLTLAKLSATVGLGALAAAWGAWEGHEGFWVPCLILTVLVCALVLWEAAKEPERQRQQPGRRPSASATPRWSIIVGDRPDD